MAQIQIKYGIDDGYVGGDRPFYATVDTCDFEPDMTHDEIKKVVWDAIEEDMRQNISAYWSEEEMPEILAAIAGDEG